MNIGGGLSTLLTGALAMSSEIGAETSMRKGNGIYSTMPLTVKQRKLRARNKRGRKARKLHR